MPRDAFTWVRSLLFTIPLILVATIAATALGLAASLLAPRGQLLESCKRSWARFLLAASFVRVSVQGRENLDGSRTCIFCANHLSYLDPPLLLACLETPVRFLAKESLFAIPFLGWAMRGEGDVPIDRENPRAAARSLARAVALVRQGISLVVFPEGGRSPDGTLQPFLSGAFHIAIRAQAPVVPIAIRGTREALRPGSLHFRGGRVQVAIGKPISTHGLSAGDQDNLSIAIREKIQTMLEDLSARPASAE